MIDNLSKTQTLSKEELLRNFQKDQEPLIRIWVDKLSLIGVILVPLFSLVDWILYSEHFYQFLTYRLIASFSCVVIFIVNRLWNLGVYSSYLAVLGYYVVGLSILKMIVDVGGYATPYYAGLNLVFIAFGVLYPLRFKTIALHCIGMYLIYLITVLLQEPSLAFQLDSSLIFPGDPNSEFYRLFISNNFFVASSLFIIIIAAAVGHNLRFREYKLRMELEEAKHDLQEANEMLEITLARKHRDLIENLHEKKLVEEMKNKLEEQLVQSQKMEAIGRLAGGVAHDFNNILTIIKANSDLLLMRMDDNNPYRKKIGDIRNASERAAGLIRQLLAFSRKQRLQPRELNLNHVIKSMKDLLERLMGEDIVLKVYLESDLGLVKADPSQIEQVIMNLVINARDAMPRGGVITVRTANVSFDRPHEDRNSTLREGDYILMSVNDTGVGMDRETQSHIFEPFFTTKEVGKGTGLGLATVYGIIKQSEGSISVYSEPGKGSTFKVYLPRIASGVERVAMEALQVPLMRGRETILLVEDDDTVRSLAREILEENGYTIFEANNGADAVRICEERGGAIDLLLTDVIMPKMSGGDLAGHVSRELPNVKILYMSGYTNDAILHHGLIEDGVSLLEKPFTAYTLTQKVRNVLDGEPDTKNAGRLR
ncbi:MAG: response regulator [bacterium]|nr:response regulator [bacterium]